MTSTTPRRTLSRERNRSIRAVELDHETTSTLTAYVDAHRVRALSWFSEHTEHSHPGNDLPLFVGMRIGHVNGLTDLERLDFSKPMRHGLFYGRHWKATLKKLGLPANIRFYDLRHAHISWLVATIGQPGALSLKEISDRVGHSSAVMTLDRYAHSPAGQTDRKRDALSAFFASAKPDNVVPITKHAN